MKKNGNTYTALRTDCTTNNQGNCVFDNLDDGTYYIKETYSDSNKYDSNDIEYPAGDSSATYGYKGVVDGYMQVVVNKANLREYTIGPVINKRLCNARLSDLGANPSKQQLVELYQYEKGRGNDYNHLLVFGNPKCETISTCSNDLSTSCLKPNLNSDSSFSENNFSCYTDTIETNSKTGYCITNFTGLDTVDSYNPRKVYSGQMYFDVSADNGNIMSGNFKQTCYFVSDISSNSITKNKKISDYIFDLKLVGTTLNNNEYPLSINDDEEVVLNKINSKKFEYTKNVDFKIPEVWVDFNGKKLSDKCLDSKCTSLGYGILSSINKEGQDIYSFSASTKTERDETPKTSSDSCTYESEKQVVDSKLNIEFREIDTDNAFTKKDGTATSPARNTMTNWCYDVRRIKNLDDITDVTEVQRYLAGVTSFGRELYTDNEINDFDAYVAQYYLADHEESSCSNDNIVSEYFIKGRTNSYNKKYIITNGKATTQVEGDGPKYKIRLTQSLINQIKDDAKTMNITYDNFNLDCKDKDGNDCEAETEYKERTSKLLTDLYNDGTGPLKIYYSEKRNISK